MAWVDMSGHMSMLWWWLWSEYGYEFEGKCWALPHTHSLLKMTKPLCFSKGHCWGSKATLSPFRAVIEPSHSLSQPSLFCLSFLRCTGDAFPPLAGPLPARILNTLAIGFREICCDFPHNNLFGGPRLPHSNIYTWIYVHILLLETWVLVKAVTTVCMQLLHWLCQSVRGGLKLNSDRGEILNTKQSTRFCFISALYTGSTIHSNTIHRALYQHLALFIDKYVFSYNLFLSLYKCFRTNTLVCFCFCFLFL